MVLAIWRSYFWLKNIEIKHFLKTYHQPGVNRAMTSKDSFAKLSHIHYF